MERKGYVRYAAPTQFNTRTITKQNWLDAGVEDMDQIHWGPETNWKVPAKRFSDDAWPIVEADSSLVYEPESESRQITPGGDDDRVEVSEPTSRETVDTGEERGGR